MEDICRLLNHTYTFVDDACPVPLEHLPEYGYVSIGNCETRRRVADRLLKQGKGFGPRLCHPASTVSYSAKVMEGSVVMAGAIVQPYTHVGKHVIVNTNANIDHDCTIGDYAHIAPGAVLCGSVTVGEGAFIGAGAIIVPGVTVGRWAFIKAGTVVKERVPDGEMAAVDAAAGGGGAESLRERGA